MNKFGLLLSILLVTSIASSAQNVEIIKYPDLHKMMETEKSTDITIYNFWATWCAPCVKEMPYFEKINHLENVKVIFISFDEASKIHDRVKPYLKRKNIQADVYLLDETDFNKIIDKIEPSWSGAIPATILINNKTNKRLFYEKGFKEGELEEIVRNQN